MENLEEQIITRLNNYLEKYGFCIRSVDTDANLFGPYHDVFNWGLFIISYSGDSIIHRRRITLWKTSNDMLLSKKHNVFKDITYSPYNKACDLRYCISNNLEELAMKMDLMGI
jgi:hypothetical protein